MMAELAVLTLEFLFCLNIYTVLMKMVYQDVSHYNVTGSLKCHTQKGYCDGPGISFKWQTNVTIGYFIWMMVLHEP